MLIDITPTYSESARTSAYILAMHSQSRPEDFLGGTYWDANYRDETVAVATFNEVLKVVETLGKLNLNFYEQSKSFKRKVIMNAFEIVNANL